MNYARGLLLLLIPYSAWAGGDDARAVLQNIGFDQKLDRQVPPELQFTDEAGKRVMLGDYFGRGPLILTLVYHRCPMLCGAGLTGLVTCLRAMSLSAGKDFQILTVSIDPNDNAESAAGKKAEYIRMYGRAGAAAGWHFLTGDAPAIAALADAVGFRYRFDKTSGQFAHASGLALLTPQGKISRYCFGVEYYPRDVGLGLVEASHNRIGTLADQVLLYCYRYDPLTGRYGLAILALLRGGGILTLLALGTFMALQFRRDWRRRRLRT